MRIAQKVTHQNSTRINHEQFNLMLPLQLIPYHITITSYYIFKPFRHRPAFLINKMLRNQIPTLHNELLCSAIIPVRIFLQVLLWWLPTVFNRREIRGGRQLKKYSRLFSSFRCRTMLRFFALPCPLSPSSSKTKSCFSNSHGFTIGSKIWLMYTWSDILPFVLPGTL